MFWDEVLWYPACDGIDGEEAKYGIPSGIIPQNMEARTRDGAASIEIPTDFAMCILNTQCQVIVRFAGGVFINGNRATVQTMPVFADTILVSCYNVWIGRKRPS